jgi:hypothetical protein
MLFCDIQRFANYTNKALAYENKNDILPRIMTTTGPGYFDYNFLNRLYLENKSGIARRINLYLMAPFLTMETMLKLKVVMLKNTNKSSESMNIQEVVMRNENSQKRKSTEGPQETLTPKRQK